LNRFTAVLLCLMMCLTETFVPSASAAIPMTSAGSTSTWYLFQERDAQGDILPGSNITTSGIEQTDTAQYIVSFTPRQNGKTFLSLLKDESIDVIELNGTYHLPYVIINVDRVRPVVVRPAAGATVVLSGTTIGTDPQFSFGFGDRAGNITMQGFIFDGFTLGQQGIIQALDCHDITLNDMVVRNSRGDSRYAEPYQVWAVYLDATVTVFPTNFTASHWTVDGSNQQMSALTVCGGNHITAADWSVSNAYYAIYASGNRGPLTDFVLDGWEIDNTGAAAWKCRWVSVAIENSSGQFSNMHATASGVLLNMGKPKMIDGGGNSLLVPLVSPGRLMGSSSLPSQHK
jgi:hypothetical protein